MKLLPILIISLFVVGCTPQLECPTITCSPCEKEPIIELEEELITKVMAGTEVYLIQKDSIDIVNCGKTAYSSIVIDAINDIKGGKKLRNLIVPNTEKDYIGGCKDIIIEYPELELIIIHGPYQYTNEFEEIIRWTPSSKLIIDEKEYNLPDLTIIDYE